MRAFPIPLLAVLVGVLALVPRVWGLNDFYTIDEGYHWPGRVERFADALAAGDWAQTGSTRRRGWLLVLSALTLLINLSAVPVDQSRYLVGLGERDPDRYLERTILRVEDSPLTRQWPIVLELADLYARPATWEAARSAIDQHLQAYRGPAEFESISTHAMWVDEFFRLNAPDFWFVHLLLLGFPPLPIVLVALGLLATALIAGVRLLGELKVG